MFRFGAMLLLLAGGTLASAQESDLRTEVDSLNRDLRATIHARGSAGRPDPRVSDQLARRASLVRHLIRQSPRDARGLILRPEEIAAFPGGLVEAPASYISGDEVRLVDSSDGRSSYYVYPLHTPEGEVQAYQDGSVGESPGCGQKLRLEGYRLADTMLVTRATAERNAITPDPGCPTVGEQRAAVLLVSFPSRPIKAMIVEQYRDTFFSPNGPSVNHFYQEQSYGQTSLSGDVFGPFTLDRDYDSCSDSSTLESLALKAAEAAVDLSKYSRVFIVTPAPSTCGFGAYGTVGCYNYQSAGGAIRLSKVYQFDAVPAEILRVSPHELGHNLGLLHSRFDALHGEPLSPDRSRFSYTEYGDRYSSMGADGPYHFSAPHKLMLNWLVDGSSVKTVTSAQVVDLAPMSAPSGGLKGVRVRRNLNTEEYIWIEYRTPAGYDKALENRLHGGALIHYEDPSTGAYAELLNFGSSFNDAELGAGSVWRDPYSDLTVQVLEALPDRLRVAIQYERPCATVTWPSLSRCTAAGGTYGYAGDGGQAARAQLGSPQALKFDGAGNLWIADSAFHVVRRIAADGTIATVAGSGAEGFSGEQGPAWSIRLNSPAGIAFLGDDVLIADTGNDRIRRLTPAANPQPAVSAPALRLDFHNPGNLF